MLVENKNVIWIQIGASFGEDHLHVIEKGATQY